MAWYIEIFVYFWELFKIWLYALFVIPFRQPQLLWLLTPVWLSWAFAEFFQEKQETSMGNATSNATIVLWGSIDWTRQTILLIKQNIISGFGNISIRFIIIAAIFLYGLIITSLGIKGNKIIKKIGRVREATYVLVIFTPILYGVMPITTNYIISALLFFPLFYLLVEMIDRITPNPKPIEEDKEEASKEEGFGTGLGNDIDLENKEFKL